MCFLFSLVARKIVVITQKFYISSIANHYYRLHYFLKLGSDSLSYTINQGHRPNLLSGRVHKSQFANTKLNKAFTCGQRDEILGQKKSLSSLSILFAYLPIIALVFLRRFQPRSFWLRSLL